MFKKWLTTLVIFISFPLFGSAQILEDINLQLNTGTTLTLTATHFEKYWGPGIHFGGGFEYPLNDVFILKWDGAFNSFIFNHEDWKADLLREISSSGEDEEDFVVNGGNRYLLETSVGIKVFPVSNEHINPFLMTAIGMVNMNTDDLILGFGNIEFRTETVPYFTVGLGSDISYWDGFDLFGQVVYKYALTKDENSENIALDFEDKFETQETSLIAIEFGILFDLSKK